MLEYNVYMQYITVQFTQSMLLPKADRLLLASRLIVRSNSVYHELQDRSSPLHASPD